MDKETTKTSSSILQCCYTNCDVISSDFHWKIHNFLISSLDKIESSIVPTSNENEPKWKIVLEIFKSKDKVEESHKTYISLYLQSHNSIDKQIKASCIFSITKDDGSVYFRSFSSIYGNKILRDGIEKFIEYNDLFMEKYLENDMLHITCKIKWTKQNVNSHIEEVQYVGTEVLHKDLSDDISSLYEDKRFSDICLKVDDVKFRVHKIILSARSSVFAAMFEHDMKEKQQDVIKIQEIKPEIMKDMINFIYTGHVDKIKENAVELLKAADMYNLKNLKLLCENELCKSFTVENVTEILQMSDLYNSENLKRMAINFIKLNLSDVSKTEDFQNFTGSNSCLIEIVKSLAIKNVD